LLESVRIPDITDHMFVSTYFQVGSTEYGDFLVPQSPVAVVLADPPEQMARQAT